MGRVRKGPGLPLGPSFQTDGVLDPMRGVAAETLLYWRVRERVGVSWPPPTSASSLFSLLLSLHFLPLPPPPLTKALCTQPLPLAAVSEPRPYENHMGERGWKRRGWGSQRGPAPPASITPLPSGYVLGGWHTLPQTPLTGSWWLGTDGRALSRARGPEGDLCSRTTSLRLRQRLRRGHPSLPWCF